MYVEAKQLTVLAMTKACGKSRSSSDGDPRTKFYYTPLCYVKAP